jgi:hypothetical protein
MITIPGRRGLVLPYMGRRSFFLVITLFASVFVWLYNAVSFTTVHVLDAASDATTVTNLISTKTGSGPFAAKQGGGSSSRVGVAPQAIDFAAYPYTPDSNRTVNLVLATTAKDDISWTERLQIPNLQIIRYVADNASAEYHPPVPRGREALMYHTYFHDHYDDLADLTILVHAEENPWHADAELWSSMVFTLSNLNLNEVARRGYANLRVSWYQACPDWINTTLPAGQSTKVEEPYAAEAFLANFAADADGHEVAPFMADADRNVVAVPEIFAGPCCSQFAVTRDAVRSRPREAYARAQRWLADTPWPDQLTGRVWERMWAWLFVRRGADCPVEWKTYCRLYGVCFPGGATDLAAFRALHAERADLLDLADSPGRALLHPWKALTAGSRIVKLTLALDARLRAAMDRGRVERARIVSGADGLGDLYEE